MVTSDEDEESEIEGLMEETQTTAPPARPKPRPAYRPAAPAEDQDLVTETDDEDVGSALLITPTGRPRPIATYKSTKSPNKSPNQSSQPGVNGTSSPKNPRKREREDDEEQSAADEGGSPAPRTQSSDIQVRRKRVRH